MDMFAYFRNFKNAFSRHNKMTCTHFSVFLLLSIFAFVILLALFSGIQLLLVSTLLTDYLTVAYVELSNYFIFLLSFLIAFIPAMLHAIKLMKQ
ncbi:hypothetical protein CS369_09970 [Candidatus Symbiopectobacterium sp. 'North America']|nr:hypothetical protein [Candidatus Symbiopectobacterium sp. 'North America']